MPVSISQALSAKFKGISFICAMLVVLLHAYNPSMDSMAGPFHLIGHFLSIDICGIAVPFFFIISGYLLACQIDSGASYSQLVTRRLKSLGLPYLYWCLIYTFTLVAFTIYGNHLAERPLNTNTPLILPLTSWQNPFRLLGFDFSQFPACGPLWFVRNLILLALVSPILWAILRHRGTSLIFLAVLAPFFFVHFTIHRPWWQFWQIGFSFKGLFFFSSGIYLRRFPVPWKPSLAIALSICMVWLLLAWPWGIPKNSAFVILHASFPIGCLALWYIYDFLPFRKSLENMHAVKYSFFIFVSHYAILNMLFCQKSCDLLKKHHVSNELTIYALRFIITAAFSIFLAQILERLAPKLYRALTGRR